MAECVKVISAREANKIANSAYGMLYIMKAITEAAKQGKFSIEHNHTMDGDDIDKLENLGYKIITSMKDGQCSYSISWR